MNVLSLPHQVTRLIFDAGQPYERFRGQYEAAVPPADPRRGNERGGRHARRPDSAADRSEACPHGFVLYWRAVMTPRTTTAGGLRPCTGYLMGSHAIADRIRRQDPAVMLYTPLRTLIYIDSADRTRFAVDQPSTVLAGLADPAIAELGVRLDRQLANLLDALGLGASGVLGAAGPAGRARTAPLRASGREALLPGTQGRTDGTRHHQP